MPADAAIAETSVADSPTGVAPIIPEVGLETKQLVLVLEMDLISVPVENGGGNGGPPPPTSATFYVSSLNGSDSDDGATQATAWATIAKVNAAALPANAAVLFERGSKFRGAGISVSVSSVNYGVYGSGAKPEICGAPDLDSTGSWTHAANGRWTAAVAENGGQPPEICWFDGTRRAPAASSAAVEIGAASDWFWGSGVLHVQSGGSGLNPANVWADISINRIRYGFHDNNRDNLTLTDIIFTHFRQNVFTEGNNNTFLRCEMHRASRTNFQCNGGNAHVELCTSTNNALTGTQGAHGFNFTAGAHDCLLLDCTADDNREDNIQIGETCGNNIVIDGGTFTNPGENCFDRKNGSGHILRNATMSNSVDHPTIVIHNTGGGTSGSMTIEDCIATHSSSNNALDVIENNALVSRRNYYRANASSNQAARFRALSTGFTTINCEYDIFWSLSSNHAINFDSGCQIDMNHCTVVCSGGRAVDGDQDARAGADARFEPRNCIFRSGSGSFVMELISNGDYNAMNFCLLYRAQTGDNSYIGHEIDTGFSGANWGTWLESQIDSGAYTTARGALANRVTADPLFTNLATGDFSLQVGSPARLAASDGTHLGAWQG